MKSAFKWKIREIVMYSLEDRSGCLDEQCIWCIWFLVCDLSHLDTIPWSPDQSLCVLAYYGSSIRIQLRLPLNLKPLTSEWSFGALKTANSGAGTFKLPPKESFWAVVGSWKRMFLERFSLSPSVGDIMTNIVWFFVCEARLFGHQFNWDAQNCLPSIRMLPCRKIN